LSQRFDWDLGQPAVQANRTEPVEVADEFRERVAHDNAYDVELYDFATGLLNRRRRTGAPSARR
jgi:hypothetical protein